MPWRRRQRRAVRHNGADAAMYGTARCVSGEHGRSFVTGQFSGFMYVWSFTSVVDGFTRVARCMCYVCHVADRITIDMRKHLQQADIFASK